MNRQCKIDAHIPTDDGSFCLCGYFESSANADINRKDGLYPNAYDKMEEEYVKAKEIKKILRKLLKNTHYEYDFPKSFSKQKAYERGFYDYELLIKQKAKELYNIIL